MIWSLLIYQPHLWPHSVQHFMVKSYLNAYHSCTYNASMSLFIIVFLSFLFGIPFKLSFTWLVITLFSGLKSGIITSRYSLLEFQVGWDGLPLGTQYIFYAILVLPLIYDLEAICLSIYLLLDYKQLSL